jgi:hypothetical protein
VSTQKKVSPDQANFFALVPANGVETWETFQVESRIIFLTDYVLHGDTDYEREVKRRPFYDEVVSQYQFKPTSSALAYHWMESKAMIKFIDTWKRRRASAIAEIASLKLTYERMTGAKHETSN